MSKCIGFDMRVIPMLPWTWRTAKFKRNGSGMRARCYLGLGAMPSLSVLGLSSMSDPHHLGLGALPSPSALVIILNLTDCQDQMHWVWYAC
jgi:hypothetical protein